MATVNISDELYQELQNLLNKENTQISLDSWVESTIIDQLNRHEDGKTYYYPSQQEETELLAAIAEDDAEDAAGIGTTQEEMDEYLSSYVDELAAKRKVSA